MEIILEQEQNLIVQNRNPCTDFFEEQHHKCSPRLSKTKYYALHWVCIIETTSLHFSIFAKQEHQKSKRTQSKLFSMSQKNLAINPEVHHKKPLKEFGYGVVHMTTLFTFLVFLSPSFICSFFSLSMKLLKKSTPSKHEFFSFFFLFVLGQFCNVATPAIIHKEIQPCLAIDQV